MSISTRKGDAGKSALGTGYRLTKASLVFEALGSLDELNAALGLARLRVTIGEFRGWIKEWQADFIQLSGLIAGSPSAHKELFSVQSLDEKIKKLESKYEIPTKFLLPGENEAEACLHWVRAIARRSERSVVVLLESEGKPTGLLGADILPFLNRFSDVIWLMALAEGRPEIF